MKTKKNEKVEGLYEEKLPFKPSDEIIEALEEEMRLDAVMLIFIRALSHEQKRISAWSKVFETYPALQKYAGKISYNHKTKQLEIKE